MRVVIDNSWGLLGARGAAHPGAAERFRGGCRRAAAVAVAFGTDGFERALRTQYSKLSTHHLLAALIDKSLLRRTIDPDGSPRYVMHELVRQYAAARLAEQAWRAAALL